MACTTKAKPTDRLPRRARIHNFTEATSVTRVVSAPPYAFAATASGLDQWDLRSGRQISLAPLATFAERVIDLAYDPRRRVLWIVGADGVARFDLDLGAVTHLPPPPANERAAAFLGAVVTPSPDGGVWLGLADGLYFADPAGVWQATGITAPVLALHQEGKRVWVGTSDGLYLTAPNQPAEPSACDLIDVRALVDAPGSGILAVGEVDGEQRVGHIDGGRCELYRSAPDRRWLDATSSAGQVLVLASAGLYRLTARGDDARRGRVRRLSRGGMTLIPVTPSPDAEGLASAPFRLRAISADVPAGAQTVAISGQEVLVGTRSLGTARLGLQTEGRSQPRWLRRRELARSAIHLSVDCAEADPDSGAIDCLLANGSGAVWEFDGERFVRREGALSVAAVTSVGERRFELITREGEPILDIHEDGGDSPVASVAVPDGSELRIAAAGPGLSLILAWADAGGDVLAPLGGASWVDLERGREVRLAAAGRPIYDVARCGDGVFAATDAGVVEIRGDRGRSIGSGPVLRLACDRSGHLLAATPETIARLEGERWTELVSLSEPVRDLAVGSDGRVFFATGDGLGVWSDGKVRRYDVRRGLLDNDVLEIAIDEAGRIWLRGRVGLGLIRL